MFEEHPVTADPVYQISQFAALFGVTPKTLRFYEERELLQPFRRGGARLYSENDKVRMEIILKAKRFGFSLAETWELLQGWTRRAGKGANKASDLCLNTQEIELQLEKLRRQRETITDAIAELHDLLARSP